jgi:hypothetical protein
MAEEVLRHKEFHLQQFGPTKPWPNGGWSLSEITGEQIAERTIWTKDSGKYEVAERWPWPGFIGCFTTLDEAVAEMRARS